jgi:hypothetical protein
MADRVFEVMRNLVGDSSLVAAASISGGDNTEEVQSLNFHGKNPRSDLNLLYI